MRWFGALVALTLVFKLWLSALFPMTGDEAYFVWWGVEPALGFYDHPPMVGWLLALLVRVSWSEWLLRLPVTLLPAILAAAIYGSMRARGESKALLAAAAFLLLPVNVWNVFITTDTPLVFFSIASGLAFWQAIERRSLALYALSGGFLGLAFLSKYFSALLALAYLAYVLASPKTERNWRGLALALACAAPFGLINLYWNYEHCWANLMFNVYNRHGDAALSWKTPLLFVVTAAYVLSPIAAVQLARARARLREGWQDPSIRFFLVACAVPFAIFAGLSTFKLIGLHWALSFVPFFFLAAAMLLTEKELRHSVVYLGLFSLVHVAAITAALALPLETWQRSRLYDGIVYHFRIHDLLDAVRPFEKNFRFAADGYSPASTASFYLRRHVAVFGPASSHARHDDILTDFRELQGGNILVLRKSPPADSDYRPYFTSVEYRSVTLSGAVFYIVLGKGFDYPAYRDGVLAPVRERYYRIPWYLPQGRCYFCERYFGSPVCPARG